MAAENIHMVEQTDKDVEKKVERCNYLLLSNKMKVMLIKDPSTSKVSVALDIHIGNFSNPDDFPGLAHLCQRMTILGNNKYPEYKGFPKLIHSHDGNISLTTSSDHTTYYFYVHTDDDSVFKILHYFVQLFTSLPLFEDSWIEEEIRIMDSLLETKLQQAWFKYFERSTVNSKHPYSKYGLCKKNVMTEMPVEQIKLKLINFFKRYYSANIMTLCIVSNFKSHYDQRIVNIFDKLPNREIKIIESYEDPFKDQFCTEWYIVPKIDTRNDLLLLFPLPNEKADYWYEAIKCISFFLKFNRKDSLLETLKAKDWCSDISATGYQEARNLNFCYISINLLPLGYFYINRIITMIFEYFNVFKNKYFTSENDRLRLKNILFNLYKFNIIEKEQTFTQQRIIKIAKRIHEYSASHILVNQCEHLDEIVPIIKIILDHYIHPQNIRVYVINDGYKQMTSKSSGWDDSNYTKRKIQEFIINIWSKPPHSELLISDLELQLFEQLFCEKIPDVIEETPFFKIWHTYAWLQSSLIPQCSKLLFHFISPHVYESPLNTMLYYIFFKLVKRTIQKKHHEDIFHYHIDKNNYGIFLTVSSYVSIIYNKYVSDSILKIFNIKICYNEFQKIKDKGFMKLKFYSPNKQAHMYLSNLLLEKNWTIEEILKENASTDITIDDMYKFIQKYISNMYVKCLICGEIAKEEALLISKYLKTNAEAANWIPMETQAELLPCRVIKLEYNTHVLFEVVNEFDNVSYTLIYYQVGKGTIDITLNLALLSYIIHDRCSQYFKNIEHSKIYVDKCQIGAAQGLIFGIESIMDPYVIQRHIHQLISDMPNYIYQFSKDVFEKYKTDLITLGVLSLHDISNDPWIPHSKCTSFLYCSELKEIEKTNIEGITQTSLASFYEEHISNKNAALSVHVLPKNKDKLKKEDPSQLEKFSNKQSESSDEYNKPVPGLSAKIHEPQFKKIETILQFKQTHDFYDEDTT